MLNPSKRRLKHCIWYKKWYVIPTQMKLCIKSQFRNNQSYAYSAFFYYTTWDYIKITFQTWTRRLQAQFCLRYSSLSCRTARTEWKCYTSVGYSSPCTTSRQPVRTRKAPKHSWSIWPINTQELIVNFPL